MTLADTRDASGFMDPVTLAQTQLERVQASLNRACKMVGLYRERFAEAGVGPENVESLEDLANLPMTRREDLARHYPYDLFAVPLRDIVRIHTAAGLTNRPTVTGYTSNDLTLWKRVVGRALAAAGVGEHDILQIHLDPGLVNWGRDYKDGAESLGASVIPLTPLSLEKQQMVLKDFRTTVLVTTPSAGLLLVDALFEAGISAGDLALKTLILVGEPLSAQRRSHLEKELNLTAWSHFGLSEVPGPAIAFECEAHKGLHVSEDNFYPEVVDPETGRPVSSGEEGELVLTTLSTRAFPLVRFRTGDRVRFFTEPCSCGRTYRKIEWLPRRTDGCVVIRGVKVHQAQIITHIERTLGFVPEGIVLSSQGKKFQGLTVRLGVDDRLFSDEIKELEQAVQSLEILLRQELGVPVRVRLTEKQTGNASPDHWEMDPEDYR